MKKLKLLNFIPVIITAPAIILGIVAMYFNSISSSIWIQNIIFYIVIAMISYCVVCSKAKVVSSNLNSTYIVVSLVLLILTFISPSMEGVHRWVSLGIINLNISMIILPIMIVELWKLSQVKGLGVTLFLTIVISSILFIQPDASQLTAFSIPMMIILCNRSDKKVFQLAISIILTLLIILSWIFLDGLATVDYVENIVQLVANMGSVWLVVGVISLVLLPMPFIFFPIKEVKLLSICIGLYFLIILISTVFGNFPVPLMGYGISPIIGYFFAITWYTKSKIN